MPAVTPKQFNDSALHGNFHTEKFILLTNNPNVLSAYEKMINPNYKNDNDGTIGSKTTSRTRK